MAQYNTSLFFMYVLNGRQRLDAVVVVSSRVDKIDGAVVWLFIVAAAACRKLDPCQCCVFNGYFSIRIDDGLQEVSSSRYFDISGPNPVTVTLSRLVQLSSLLLRHTVLLVLMFRHSKRA